MRRNSDSRSLWNQFKANRLSGICKARKPAHDPPRSKTDGRRRHPGARESRPPAIPFGAAQFPCDAAPGYSAGG